MKSKCLFCLVVQKKISANVILENESIIVFFDINPLSQGHCLIVTKKHYDNLFEISYDDWNKMFFIIKETSEILKKKYSPKGFNLISNIGKEAYQSIKHLHIHLIPKYNKKNGFIWQDNQH